jgi:hypothetical protein
VVNLHKDRKNFLEQLKGTYIDWEAFYDRLMSENIGLFMPEEFEYCRCTNNADEFDSLKTYTGYYGTESDIDWKMVSFRLLRFLGDYKGKWHEDCWENWFDFNDEKHKKVVKEFSHWYENEVSKQRTTFLPSWYTIKHTMWERKFGEQV